MPDIVQIKEMLLEIKKNHKQNEDDLSSIKISKSSGRYVEHLNTGEKTETVKEARQLFNTSGLHSLIKSLPENQETEPELWNATEAYKNKVMPLSKTLFDKATELIEKK